MYEQPSSTHFIHIQRFHSYTLNVYVLRYPKCKLNSTLLSIKLILRLLCKWTPHTTTIIMIIFWETRRNFWGIWCKKWKVAKAKWVFRKVVRRCNNKKGRRSTRNALYFPLLFTWDFDDEKSVNLENDEFVNVLRMYYV